MHLTRDSADTDIYFCEPASPHQKGCIENGNSNIRLEFQRDYAVDQLKQRTINAVINAINNGKTAEMIFPAQSNPQMNLKISGKWA